jgi:hypothetical protein
MNSGSGRPLRVGVVGAGSSGLLLALLLQRQGHGVELFERAPALRTDGCGILLVSSGVEAVAAAAVPGLLEALLAGGLPVQRFVIRNLRGDTIETSPVEREPEELPALLIHRQAILEALWGALDPPASAAGGSFSTGVRSPMASRLPSLMAPSGAATCWWAPTACFRGWRANCCPNGA